MRGFVLYSIVMTKDIQKPNDSEAPRHSPIPQLRGDPEVSLGIMRIHEVSLGIITYHEVSIGIMRYP